MTLVLGFTGLAGAGKDTAASMLADLLPNPHLYAFAQPLKEACKIAFGLSDQHVYGHEKETPLKLYDGVTSRQIMQWMGTELGRNLVHKDVWLKRATLEYSLHLSPNKTFIVTDVRFDNEAQWVHERAGYVIEVIRPNQHHIATSNHQSERGVDPALIHHTLVNDGTRADLRTKVRTLYHELAQQSVA